jgi:AraC-like DNA-binding protein
MHIVNIGYNHSHDADFYINRPHGSGDYLLLLLKTPAVFTFHEKDEITATDSFIMYSEHTPQLYRAYGSEFSNDWFHFKLKEEEEAYIARLNIPLNQVIHIGDLHDLSMMINNLSYETYASNPYKSEIMELSLKLFFIKLSNKIYDSQDEITNTHYNKMSIIRSKIYNQPFQQWTIEGLSHELTMSKSSFQHLYKKIFGVSPITDVITSRMEHAKYLLKTTDIAVKKIAEMCGYNNEIHFMRQFKQQVKRTPSEYRDNTIDHLMHDHE